MDEKNTVVNLIKSLDDEMPINNYETFSNENRHTEIEDFPFEESNIIWHFLMNASILRTILLLPVMRRKYIKYPDNGETSLSINQAEDEPDSEVSCTTDCLPVVSSSALLLESENALRYAYFASDFYDSAENFIDIVWSSLIVSLVTHGIVNYFLYPEERAYISLLDMFGITGLINFACFPSNDFFKKLCFSENGRYNDMLFAALSNKYILMALIGIPAMVGILNGARTLNSWAWSGKPIKKDYRYLYKIPQLPDLKDMKKYRNSYILHSRGLCYISFEGNPRAVVFPNGEAWKIFFAFLDSISQKNLSEASQENPERIYLSADNIHDEIVIPSSGNFYDKEILHDEDIFGEEPGEYKRRVDDEDLDDWLDNLECGIEAVSYIFPIFSVFKLFIPHHAIKEGFERLKQSIIWDGRLSVEDRYYLYKSIPKFIARSGDTAYAKTKAISTLADIVNGISDKNISIMKRAGVAPETIAILQKIRKKARNLLEYCANDYSIELNITLYYKGKYEKELVKDTSRLRYLYANYHMWNLGFGSSLESRGQQVLKGFFYTLKAVRLYFTLLFYKAIIAGVSKLIIDAIERKNCLDGGDEWASLENLNEFCSKCPDFDIFARDIFNVSTCVSAYFGNPRVSPSFEDIMKNIVYRNLQKNSAGVNRSFDLSELTSLSLPLWGKLKEGELAELLTALKPKMTNLKMFNLNANVSQTADRQAFIDFIYNSSIEELIFRYVADEQSLKAIGEVLPQTNIKMLFLNAMGNELYNVSVIHTFAQGLQNSEVNDLRLDDFKINDVEMEVIASVLPRSKITSFQLRRTDITSGGCQAVAKQLPLSSIQSLIFLLPSTQIDSLCANALISALSNITRDFNLDLSPADGIVVGLFAKALSRSPSLPLKSLLLSHNNNVTQEEVFDIIDALPKSQLVEFFMNFPVGLNNSLLLPKLADALDRSQITTFKFNLRFNTTEDVNMLISFLPNKLRKISSLIFQNNPHGGAWSEDILNALFKALPYTNITTLNLFSNYIGRSLSALAKVLPDTAITELNLDYNNITANDIKFLANVLRQSKIKILSLFHNLIGDEGVKYLFGALPNSALESLILGNNNISDDGAIGIADTLRADKFVHELWIDFFNEERNAARDRTWASPDPTTNLTLLTLYDVGSINSNRIQNCGASQICDVRYQTDNMYFLINGNISKEILDDCGSLLSNRTYCSSANSLYPTGPYVFFYRAYRASREWFYTTLFQSDENNPAFSEENITEASSYSPEQTVMLDTTQSRGVNFIQAGKNHLLRLGFFSKDHVVVTVTESQGTIQISGFDSSKDTLHLISEHTVYNIKTNITICQNDIIDHVMPAAVIRLKETTVQLLGAQCEDIENSISLNNPEALDAAKMETLEFAENHQFTLYKMSLIGVCGIFLNSIAKSAIFSAAPLFVAEILYRTGGYTRPEAEKFAEEIQTLLVLSFAESPHAITASFLAGLIASRLTHSPKVISAVSIGASIVTTVAATVLNTDAALGWVALQAGIAIAGSVLGSLGAHKLPEIGRWGYNKASDAKNYISSKTGFRISFWSSSVESSERMKTPEPPQSKGFNFQ